MMQVIAGNISAWAKQLKKIIPDYSGGEDEGSIIPTPFPSKYYWEDRKYLQSESTRKTKLFPYHKKGKTLSAKYVSICAKSI